MFFLSSIVSFFKKALLITIALFCILPSQNVFAADASQITDSYGVSGVAASAGLRQYTSVPGLVGIVLGTVLSLIGIAFFALVLYGGVLWMTARGNADQQKKAFETIISGSIGVVLILSAYALTRFVFTTIENQAPAETPTQPSTPTPPGGGSEYDPAADILAQGRCVEKADSTCKFVGTDAALCGQALNCEMFEGQCVYDGDCTLGTTSQNCVDGDRNRYCEWIPSAPAGQ